MLRNSKFNYKSGFSSIEYFKVVIIENKTKSDFKSHAYEKNTFITSTVDSIYEQEFSKRAGKSDSVNMSETGQLGQIGHSLAALKKRTFFIRSRRRLRSS